MSLEYLSCNKNLIQNMYLFSTVIHEPKELSKNERKMFKFILYNKILSIDWYQFKHFVINKLGNKNIKDKDQNNYMENKNILIMVKYTSM